MKISAKFKNRFLKILKRIHKSKYLEEIYLYSSHSIILKISGKFEDRTIFKNAKKKKILHSTESIYVFFYYIFYWSFETIVDRVTSASRGSLFPADDGQIRLFGLRHAQNKGTSLPGEGPGGGEGREGGSGQASSPFVSSGRTTRTAVHEFPIQSAHRCEHSMTR